MALYIILGKTMIKREENTPLLKYLLMKGLNFHAELVSHFLNAGVLYLDVTKGLLLLR